MRQGCWATRRRCALSRTRRGRSAEAGQPVEHEPNDVMPAALEILIVGKTYADRPGNGPGMNQGEPAEGDDAEQELGGLARG